MHFNAPIFVVSGASGSGKTTICREMARRFGWYYSISHTTRQKREHEKNGQDYYFVDTTTFEAMIGHGDFLEWARVYDNYYGTSKRVLEEKLASGQGVILDVDTQGAASIKAVWPESILVFIDTVDLKQLEARLRARQTDHEAEIKKRMACAEGEIARKHQYDYIIINDDLDRSIARFLELIRDRTGLVPATT